MVRRQEEGAGVAGKRDKWQVNKLEKSHSMRVAERKREWEWEVCGAHTGYAK